MTLYYIKEAFSFIKRAKLASIISFITTTIAVLFFTSTIGLLGYSADLGEKLKSKIEVNFYLKDGFSEKYLEKLEKSIANERIVRSVKYVDKETAMRDFVRDTGEDFLKMLGENPLPASLQIHFKPKNLNSNKIKNLINKYDDYSIVDDVIYDENYTFTLLKLINKSKYIIYSFTTVFILLAVYLIYSTNILILKHKEKLFNTMKLVGATIKTIKIPLLLNGFLIGVFSSLFSILIMYLTLKIGSGFMGENDYSTKIIEFFPILLVSGILLGFIGSYLSSLKIRSKIGKL